MPLMQDFARWQSHVELLITTLVDSEQAALSPIEMRECMAAILVGQVGIFEVIEEFEARLLAAYGVKKA